MGVVGLERPEAGAEENPTATLAGAPFAMAPAMSVVDC